MKWFFILSFLAVLATCGSSPANDPVYQALRANPPAAIPDRHLILLRNGRASCDVFKEGTSQQYMTCWWPSSYQPTTSATLSYYGSNPFNPPEPSKLLAPGGLVAVERIDF